MEIDVPKDCGNAPKKNFLKDFHIAIASGDISFLSQQITDAISWEIIGGKSITTKTLYLEAIQNHPLWKAERLVIDKIITHGIDASVNGTSSTTKGDKFAFCDIYIFKSFKGMELKSIKSFIIPLS